MAYKKTNIPQKFFSPWSVFKNKKLNDKDFLYTHVSLFSGCGGIDLGFKQAGFKTIFANDINKDACETYRKNLGEIVLGDITKISIPNFKRVDVLSAGFPCQPFSNAGSRKGTSDDRGSLYLSALSAVEKLQPSVVMFENVRGLLSSKHLGKLVIEIICENLRNLGYNVTFALVNAAEYNVAQKRLRLIIVGVEKKRKAYFLFPKPKKRDDLMLKNIVFNIPESTPNQLDLMQLNPQAIAIGNMIPEGGSWKDIPYEKLPSRLKKISDNIERYHWPKFYRKYDREEIAGTITAAFKPENAGVWHPSESRIFSVREIARIQSFPDWFVFCGDTIKSRYQQIGNAVPPRLAYEIGMQISLLLKGVENISGNQLTFSDFKELNRPLRPTDSNVIF